MARFQMIMEILKRGNFPNATSMANEIEVSAKTVRRDIATLRDQMGVEIEYVQGKHGYVLGDVDSSLPLFDMEVGDLAALYLASQSLSGNSKLNEVLQQSFEKVAHQLEGRVSFSWQQFDELFSVRDGGVVDADLDLFGRVSSAVLEFRQLHFRYRSSGKLESELRTVDPYYVGEIQGGFYMVGFDHARGDLRTFALQRMIGVQMTGEKFERPDTFRAEEYFDGTTGVFVPEKGAQEEEAVIICKDWLARVVQEREWHPSQRTKVLDDYGTQVELRMRLSDWREVVGLVLSWGRAAKVVEPPRLVSLLKLELEAMQKSYIE